MKHFFFASIVCMILFFSCKRSVDNVVLSYNEYGDNNQLLKTNAAIQTFKTLGNDESEVTITGPNNYQKKILTKDLGGKLYWKCDNRFVISHSIDPADKTGSCFFEQPFLNKRVKLIGKRNYSIENMEYQIYSFGESNGSESDIATYYLKDVGFICYYDMERKNYFFLSKSTKTDNAHLFQLIRDKLTHDTSFFAKYLLQSTEVRFPK